MTTSRKDEHVRYAVRQQQEIPDVNDFDSVTFVHHALAGIDLAEVSTATRVAGRYWANPLYINAMTGGSAGTGRINQQLAIAAKETGLPIASGSMSPFFKDPSLADTFRVLRRENPDGTVFANVNADATVEQTRRAVDLIGADALQIHLNAVQEIVMPEGDRAFAHWGPRIEKIAAALEVPVIVKEVGFGLSRRTVLRLRDAGVAVADIGGRGGTNFARIENRRRDREDYTFLEDWGQSTAGCLIESASVPGIEILASGGIRSPLDTARAVALGARATGVAGRFLATLMADGVEALIETIQSWLVQLAQIMTVLGVYSPADLVHCDLLITGDLAAVCRARGTDITGYATRSSRRPTTPSSRAGK